MRGALRAREYSVDELAALATLLVTAHEREVFAGLGIRRTWQDGELERLRNLLTSTADQVDWFDPFWIAGCRPRENNLTDAPAKVLAPAGGHNLGNRGLLALLDAASTSAAADEAPGRIAAVRSCIETDEGYVVRREYPFGISRPDICVIGRRFVIFVEHKLGSGTETLVNGQHQTSRHAKLLERFASARGVPQAQALAILLSASGSAARDRGHIAVSIESFIEALLSACGQAGGQPSSTLKAYLIWYRRTATR